MTLLGATPLRSFWRRSIPTKGALVAITWTLNMHQRFLKNRIAGLRQ